MPYKDLEERRRYDREYKRWLRAQCGLTGRGQTRVRQADICLQAHPVSQPGMVFHDGWFVTDAP